MGPVFMMFLFSLWGLIVAAPSPPLPHTPFTHSLPLYSSLLVLKLQSDLKLTLVLATLIDNHRFLRTPSAPFPEVQTFWTSEGAKNFFFGKSAARLVFHLTR